MVGERETGGTLGISVKISDVVVCGREFDILDLVHENGDGLEGGPETTGTEEAAPGQGANHASVAVRANAPADVQHDEHEQQTFI